VIVTNQKDSGEYPDIKNSIKRVFFS